MISTVIPIQGTFDIAKGRNALRTHIAANSWPTHFTVRASALLTALGDLILMSEHGHGVIVRADIVVDGGEPGIRLVCDLELSRVDASRLDHCKSRLNRASDQLELSSSGSFTNVDAFLKVG